MSRPFFSTSERRALLRFIEKSAGVATLGASLALLLALVSYNPDDPGFYSSTWESPTNWLGHPGAMISDLLIRTLGVAGYGVGLYGAATGVTMISGATSATPVFRVFAAPFAAIAVAAFASSHAIEAPAGGGLGGVIGDFLFGVLADGLPIYTEKARVVAATLMLALTAIATTLYASGATIDGLKRVVATARGEVVSAYRDIGRGLTRVANGDAAAAAPAAIAAALAEAARGAQRLATAPFAGAEREPAMAGVAQPQPAESTTPAPTSPHSLSWLRETISGLGTSATPRSSWSEEPPLDAAPAAPREDSDERIDRWTKPASTTLADAARRQMATPPELSGALTTALDRAKAEIGFDGAEATDAEAAETAADDSAVETATTDAEPTQAADDASEPAIVDPVSEEATPEAEPNEAADDHQVDAIDATDEANGLTSSLAPQENEAPKGAVATVAQDPVEEDPLEEEPVEESGPAIAAIAPAEVHPVPALPSPYPPLELLAEPTDDEKLRLTEQMLAEQVDRLQTVLHDYGVKGEIIDAHPGPVVTLFELEPAPGLKASRVISLADDIARSMSAVSARVSTVPGRNIIGIELPNQQRETVRLRELLSHDAFNRSDHPLTLALGKDIAGAPVVANLARMPHLLIAGTTGSGKSVGINTMLLSLLYRLSPEQCRLILIDPKMLELSVYNDIPHLIAPVVTDPKKAVLALKWAVREMEQRYEKMARLNVRGLDSYNDKVAEARAKGERFERVVQIGFDEETGKPLYETQYFDPDPMPLIVIVVDEMADLMMVAGKEIEHCVQRLAQMARASGIHLIMATQRPSVDVITGTVKANFPIRISFQVTSKIDSRTIIGEQGAEQLLGRGDMLYNSGAARLTRIHGAFVSDDEVASVVSHLRAIGAPDYRVDFENVSGDGDVEEAQSLGGAADDALYDRAVAIVASEGRASTSFIQRRLQIGYNRAARIIEMMEEQGVVSPANHVGKREVLIGDASGR